MLDRLEQSGHLQRIFDTHDRRRINIKLTDTAIAMREQYDQVSEVMNGIFYEGFTEAEVQVFEQYLQRILSNLTRRE